MIALSGVIAKVSKSDRSLITLESSAYALSAGNMPIDRRRYPDNWSEIALSIKEAASWRCRHCGKQCLLPGEKSKDLTRSERTMATLTVHHANFTPEDNRPENLIALCAPCHLAIHQTGKGNVSPGQLSLFNLLF